MTLPVARPRMFVRDGSIERTAAGLELADFFDRRRLQPRRRRGGARAGRPASRAAIVEAAARRARPPSSSTAARCPAGRLGLGRRPRRAGRLDLRRRGARDRRGAARAGASVGVSFGARGHARRSRRARGRAASPRAGSPSTAASSRSSPRPAWPSLTTEPGVTADGSPRLGTLNGSSAAAAAVAGAAALLAAGAARPRRRRSSRALLVGSAQPLDGVPVVAQGAGLVDRRRRGRRRGRRRAGVDRVRPGERSRAWQRDANGHGHEHLVAPASLRRRSSGATSRPRRRRSSRSRPRFSLRPGRAQAGPRDRDASPPRRTAAPPAEGALIVRPRGRRPARVPCAVAFAPEQPRPARRARPLARARSSPPTPSRRCCSSARARCATVGGADEIEPLAKLDVELWTTESERLGVIARIRDVLPGTLHLRDHRPDARGRAARAGAVPPAPGRVPDAAGQAES